MAELAYNSVAKRPGAFPPEPLPSVILIVGADDGLKTEAMARINAVALDPAFADFDHETVDLSLGSAADDMADPVGRIIEAAGAAPFSSPRRVVTVLSVQKLAKERQDSLAALLPRISPFSLVLLIADASEMEAGKPKGRQVENSLRKSAAKVGLVLTCDAPDGGDLRSRAAAIITSAGKTAGPGVLEALVSASNPQGHPGGDLNLLTHETAKLLAYVGDRPQITRDDTSAVVYGSIDDNIFRLLDCVGARDTSRALAEVDSLLAAEGKPDATAPRLLVMLQRHFRLMMLAKFLGENKLLGRNVLTDEVRDLLTNEMASFASTQAHRMGSYAKQASNFRWDEMQFAIGRILAADISMKGILHGKQTMPKPIDFGDDAAAGIKMLVFDLCYRGK